MVVDKCQHKPFCHTGAQFFHQIQRQRGSAGPIPMKKADISVQANAFQRRCAVIVEQAVRKRQQGVDRIHWRTPVSRLEGKEGLFPQNQLVEHPKVQGCPRPFQPPQTIYGGFFRDLRQQFLKLSRYR